MTWKTSYTLIIIISYECLGQGVLVQEIFFKFLLKYTFSKVCCMEIPDFLKCFQQKLSGGIFGGVGGEG